MRVEVRGRGVSASTALREHAGRRLRFALGRFGARVARVSARLADVNGPRGGVDKECRLAARLQPAGELVVSERDADLYAAIDRAASRLGRAVSRELGRRVDRRNARRQPLG